MSSPKSLAHWSRKFRNAFRGVRVGVWGQSSFYVHAAVTTLVLIFGVVLGVSPVEWCLLVLCIGLVISAELFNSALESCAKAVTRDFDDNVRDALDIASAAVLVASIAAVIVGTAIFLFRFGFWFGWWGGYYM